MSEPRGRFLWYELLTKDPAAARDFYQALVGWGHTVWEGAMPYHMFTLDDAPIAGIMQLPEEALQGGAPSHWLGYVQVPDRDAAVEQATGLGATTMVAMEIPEVGAFAVLCDPQGALIAVYTPEQAPEPEHDPLLGEMSWHELATDDYEAAFEFYSSMFGWEVMQDLDMGPAGIYRIFGKNGRQLGGMFNRPAEMPVCSWVYYTRVASCDEAAARIPSLGGQVMIGPMEVPDGSRIAQGMDPAGAVFALHSTDG